MRNRIGKIVVVVLFGMAAAGFFVLCGDGLVRTGTGDEPHYLIVADALAHFGGPELSMAYRTGTLAKSLLPATDLDFTAEALDGVSGPFPWFHAVGGAHGLFSVHNLGLPVLLSPVLRLGGGMLAAKWMMLVILSVSLALLGWRAAEAFIAPFPQRALAALALSLTTLFTIAASQIYPDLLAGVLFAHVALSLAVRRLDGEKGKSAMADAVLLAVLAAVPWLHLRLMPPMLLCVAARFLLLPPRLRQGLAWALVPVASLAGLALYNHYAFGFFGGPYSNGDLEISATAVMVLLGLQFDQFQGVFIHAPILLFAVFGLAALARRDWRLAAFLVLLYGSLVVPNAVHTNWYGGGSFGGRFVLAGGVVLIVPAAYGMSRLFENRPRWGVAACGMHLIVQAYLWYRYALDGVPIFTQSAMHWLEDYRSAWAPHQYALPAFYRLDLALHHWPNLGWSVALVMLIAAGWMWRRQDEAAARFEGWGRQSLLLAGCAIVAGGVAGLIERPLWAESAIPSDQSKEAERPVEELVPITKISALGLTGQPVRIEYGDPSDWRAVRSLIDDLGQLGSFACVDKTLSGAQFAPDQICAAASPGAPSMRVALMQGKDWEVMQLRPNPTQAAMEFDFSRAADLAHLWHGWSDPEPWGVWSVGPRSDLRLDARSLSGDLRLDIDLMAFIPSSDGIVRVPVAVNGRHLATWVFSPESGYRHRRSLWIPASLVSASPTLTITFSPPGVLSPPGDSRPLGVGLFAATLQGN